MVTRGPFVFNRWTMEEILVCVYPSAVSVCSPCIIEICVTNASGGPDWLSQRGCSARLFSPYLLYLPVSFIFPLYFVKTLPRFPNGKWKKMHIP